MRDALRHIAKEHHAQGAGLQIGEHKASAAPATSRIHFNESEQALIESPKLQALKHGLWLPAEEPMRNRDPKHIIPHGVGTKRA